jgi:hypothetical protein
MEGKNPGAQSRVLHLMDCWLTVSDANGSMNFLAKNAKSAKIALRFLAGSAKVFAKQPVARRAVRL